MHDRPGRDPRDIITPDAFHVKPELLGIPLARPLRRGVAMLLDLAFVGLVVLLKELTGVVFWLALAWVLFRVSSRTAREGVGSPTGRAVVRIAAIVIVVFAVGAVVIDIAGDDLVEMATEGRGGARGPASLAPVAGAPGDSAGTGPDSSPAREGRHPPGANVNVTVEGLRLGDVARIPDLIALGRAGSAEEALPPARRIAESLVRAGASPPEAREALAELFGSEGNASPWRSEVVARAMAPFDSLAAEIAASSDSLALAYGRAVDAGDTTAAGALRGKLADRLSEPRLAASRARIRRLEGEVEEAREAAESPSMLAWLRDLSDELGIGIGWMGLYFTVFTVSMRGQTPGKRIVGVRVVRLNGEQIGWWTSFSRFGGYAACLATGLLGFVEIFWDANRQGLQDKMVGTVVIREGETAARAAHAGHGPAAGRGDRPGGYRSSARRS